MNRKGGMMPEAHLFPFRSALFKPGNTGWEGKGKHLLKEEGSSKGRGQMKNKCQYIQLCVGQNGFITTCIYFFFCIKKDTHRRRVPLCIRHSLGNRH